MQLTSKSHRYTSSCNVARLSDAGIECVTVPPYSGAQLTGRLQHDGIMWLGLRSVKSINVDFLNQTTSQSSSYPLILMRLGGSRSTPNQIKLQERGLGVDVMAILVLILKKRCQYEEFYSAQNGRALVNRALNHRVPLALQLVNSVRKLSVKQKNSNYLNSGSQLSKIGWQISTTDYKTV